MIELVILVFRISHSFTKRGSLLQFDWDAISNEFRTHVVIIGPRREKTCLRCMRPSHRICFDE